MSEQNDLDIQAMADAAAGDINAFGPIVERHQQNLLNFFRRLGASPHRAEDLTQETFLRLYDWRKRYRPTASFRTFLFMLARHAWADALRKQGRRIKTTAEEHAAEARHDTVGVEHVERRMDVQQALESLSEKLRAVVVLNVYNGLNYREIGDVLDIPEGTVKSRMFLAMRALRELLDEESAG